MDYTQLPVGFGMALAQRPEAMQKFASLSEKQRDEIINATHQIRSKKEMKAFVDNFIRKY